MKRRKRQMTRFRHRQGGLDGLEIPQLSNQADVRILAQNIFQGRFEARCVGPDFALIDHAGLVVVQIFDWILDRNDMLVPVHVDAVDDRGQRGRLARTRGPRDQYESPGSFGQFGHNRRQAQLLEAQDLEGNRSKGRRYVSPLHEDVSPKAGKILDPEGKIEFALLLEFMLLGIRQHRVAELLRIVRIQRRNLERMQFAIDPQLGGSPRRDVHIAGALLDHCLEELMHAGH